MKNRIACAVAVLLLLPAITLAGEWGINIHGLSYHPDKTDSEGNKLHGFNPGIGLNYAFRDSGHWVLLTEGGIFSNSSQKAAEYVSLSARLKLYRGLSIGPELGVIHSSSYNMGDPILAPLPVVSFRYHRLAVSAIYFPRYKNVNRNASISAFATIYPAGKHR